MQDHSTPNHPRQQFVDRTCQRCHVSFQVPFYRIAHGRGVYCSKACQHPKDTKRCPCCKKLKSRSEFNKDAARAGGIVSWCKECTSSYAKEYRKDHPHVAKGERASYLKQRITTLRVYSNGVPKCACCGEAQYEFLSLDHIEGSGNKHRKALGYHSKIHQWLKANNYPPGFQVLCHNCNFAKSHYGTCPHKLNISANE